MAHSSPYASAPSSVSAPPISHSPRYTPGVATRPAMIDGATLRLSYVIPAVACGFAALCYAELASMIPIAGSAYTYAYVTLGEFMAWIIGWDLILEYGVGNVAVAVSWSSYFQSFLAGFN